MRQEDFYPPQDKNCGDACECEGNFDDDGNQGGSDAAAFKAYFDRSAFLNPCINSNPSTRDFGYAGDCDGTDAAKFKENLGRSSFSEYTFSLLPNEYNTQSLM